MIYETPPRLRGDDNDKFDMLWSYLYRLVEALNTNEAMEEMKDKPDTPTPTTTHENRSFLAVLNGGMLVPVMAFGGSLAGSAVFRDSSTSNAVTVMLTGTYPAADRLPEPSDLSGYFFLSGGGYVGTPGALTDTYKVKKIIAI